MSLKPLLMNTKQTVRDPNQDYLLAETINLMTAGTQEVGARNGAFKVVCRDGTGSCEFFNVQKDPLEEFPLSKPASCASYSEGKLTPSEQDWHFCKLKEVVETQSFYSTQAKR